MWANREWMLHHDNAPVRSLLLVRNFRTKNAMTVVPQPPYSPDLALADFYLFPKMKRPMKGERCDDVEIIKKKIAEGAEEHPGRRLPEGLPAVEAALGKVYCHPKRVL